MSDYFSSRWNYVSEVGPDWDEASRKMFECMNSAFRKNQASKHAQEALKIALARVGEGHKDTITSYCNLALMYYTVNELDVATIYAQKGIELAVKYFGEGSERHAQGLDVMMFILTAQNRFDEAISMAHELLSIYTREYGPKHEESRRIDQAISDLHGFRANEGKSFWGKLFG
jgi:tetratricopeptide (TPR) repeat protein